MWTSILCIFLILALIFVPYILYTKNKTKRSKVLSRWASSRNWSFNEDSRDPEQLSKCLQQCIQHVGASYFLNIIEGDIDKCKINVFDCHIDVVGYRSRQHFCYSAVVLNTGISLKPLFIRTEKFRDTMKDFVGFNDIDFESTEFSEQFYVKAKDAKWAYDVLSQETMEFLLESPRFNLDFHDKYIIVYRSNKLLEIAAFEDAIKVAIGIFNRLPASLIQELKEVK